MSRSPLRGLPLGLVLLGLLAGCNGSSKIKVPGQLKYKGQNYTVEGGSLLVLFVPLVEEGKPRTNYPATVNRKDGSFTVELPPGKYKIAVAHGATPQAPDEFGGMFSQKDTKIVREIKDTTPIEIDLDRPEG
jgi:hypothetical protein